MPRRALIGRRGFSLIELLVVLGLLVVLATIGVAAFSNTRKVSRLVGTEQLISGMIRQARMTARATGQAVMLYVDPDTRTISGVSRLAIWQSDCESTSEPFTGALAPLLFQTPFGRSGAGLINPGAGQLAAMPLAAATGAGRNHKLTRRPTAPTEGFQLGVVVKPQQLLDANSGTPAPTVLPLLVIGEEDPATPPNTDKAFAGLVLRQSLQPMYSGGETVPTVVSGAPAFNPNPDRPVWELVGWVLPEGTTTPVFVSSLTNAIKPSNPDPSNPVDPLVAARLDPTVGGMWMDVSLVYTGNTLELERDGRLIAMRDITGTTRIEGYTKAHNLFIGVADIGPALGGSGPISTDSKTVFDDIQLVRLGVDQPQVFPGGVEPVEPKGYRALVHPDGRITPLPLGASPIVWSFRGVFDEKEDTADVTINPTSGTVSATTVKLSASSP